MFYGQKSNSFNYLDFSGATLFRVGISGRSRKGELISVRKLFSKYIHVLKAILNFSLATHSSIWNRRSLCPCSVFFRS